MALPYCICLYLSRLLWPLAEAVGNDPIPSMSCTPFFFFFYLHMLSESILEQSAFDKLLCSDMRLSSASWVDRL